jgi:YggT family protein
MFGPTCVADPTVGAETVCLLFTFLTFAIIIRALLSWFQLDPSNPLIQALDAITDPIVDPIRRIMPRVMMLDFSPLVAILLLQFISPVLQRFLVDQGI